MNGLSIDHVLKQAEKLKGGLFNTKEIFVIFDVNNIILEKGNKSSPTDNGRKNFEILLKEHIYLKE